LVDVAATDELLAERAPTYRGGTATEKASNAEAANHGEKPRAAEDEIPLPDRPLEEIATAGGWTIVEAQRVKENYLALLRKQEFEVEQGKLVEIEVISLEVEREYATVRERLLTIPGKVSAALAGCDRVAIEQRLLDEITAALAELHDPGEPDDRRGAGEKAA
jgi:hypothetical protein